ncbi:MAG: RNA 2'-phosphotransferase, partial [Oscillospiraceae bacterium]
HSVNVDVELKKAEPPEILFHGTGEKFVSSIKSEGLKPKSRLYVHLSKDRETAVKVGSRHGKPVVFEVNSGEMSRNGYEFFLSENGVWLTKNVPAEYLRVL